MNTEGFLHLTVGKNNKKTLNVCSGCNEHTVSMVMYIVLKIGQKFKGDDLDTYKHMIQRALNDIE